jgi:hypothetical protein
MPPVKKSKSKRSRSRSRSRTTTSKSRRSRKAIRGGRKSRKSRKSRKYHGSGGETAAETAVNIYINVIHDLLRGQDLSHDEDYNKIAYGLPPMTIGEEMGLDLYERRNVAFLHETLAKSSLSELKQKLHYGLETMLEIKDLIQENPLNEDLLVKKIQSIKDLDVEIQVYVDKLRPSMPEAKPQSSRFYSNGRGAERAKKAANMVLLKKLLFQTVDKGVSLIQEKAAKKKILEILNKYGMTQNNFNAGRY